MDIIRVSQNVCVLWLLAIGSEGMSTSPNWFDAQVHCASQNSTLTTDISKTGAGYWTARYRRISHWIKLIGCFEEESVTEHAAFRVSMEGGSVGYCQEICFNSNKSTFAIKRSICLCLQKNLTGSGENTSRCNYTCPKNIDDKFSTECGGNTAFNVYESKKEFNCDNGSFPPGVCVAIQCKGKSSSNYFCSACNIPHRGFCHDIKSAFASWNNSMKTCKDNNFTYPPGNLPLSSVLNACTMIHEHLKSPTWIGVAKQRYQGSDQGFIIEDREHSNFITCEKCRNNTCSFTNCTASEEIDIYCSDIRLSTVTYPQPSTTTKLATITTTTLTTTLTTTTTPTTTTSTTVVTDTTLVTSTGITNATYSSISTEVDFKLRVQGEQKTLVIGIVTLIVLIILGAGVGIGFYFWRRRRQQREMNDPVPKKTEIHLNENQTEKEHIYHEENNVNHSSYFILEPKSAYEECGDDTSKTENPYIETKEGEYDHLGNSNHRRKITDIDDYHVTTGHTIFHKETEEENYDHIGNGTSRSNIEDDTYCHTSPNQVDSSPDYDVANHTEHKDTENTYDHAGARMHLQNDSNYDYSELNR